MRIDRNSPAWKEAKTKACRALTVAKMWEITQNQVFRGLDIGETQRREMRKMYYAAFHDLFVTMADVADTLPEEEAARKMEALRDECEENARAMGLFVTQGEVLR